MPRLPIYMRQRGAFLVPARVALVSALTAASATGLLTSTAHAQAARRSDEDEDSPAPLLLTDAVRDDPVLLAHRSHSSHSSHRSHVSGGGGGGYVAPPAPRPAPWTPPTPAPQPAPWPAPNPPPTRATTPIATLPPTASPAPDPLAQPTAYLPPSPAPAPPPAPVAKRGCSTAPGEEQGGGLSMMIAAIFAGVFGLRRKRDER